MRAPQRVRALVGALLAPTSCLLCGEWVANPDWSPLCPFCLDALEPLPSNCCRGCAHPLGLLDAAGFCLECRRRTWPWEALACYGAYRTELRRLILGFKFEGWPRLAHPLSLLLERCCRQRLVGLRWDWVVAVPSHPRRVARRGFDHGKRLAAALARRLGIPLLTGVERVRNTVPQAGLSRYQRSRNLKSAFALAPGCSLEGTRLLLVDDVMTSGATLLELARLLRRRGKARGIWAVTVGRRLGSEPGLSAVRGDREFNGRKRGR